MITTIQLPEILVSTTASDLIHKGIVLDTTIVDITPDIAQDLIDNMDPRQRKLNNSTVRKYSLIMTEGCWRQCTLDGIVISKEGKVLNAQHRLQAVIDTGLTWKARVTFNVDPDQFLYMDQARKRTTKDFLDCLNSEDISSIGRRICAMETGEAPLLSVIQSKLTARDVVPDTLNIRFCQENEDYLQGLTSIGRRMYSAIGRKGGRTVYSFFIALMTYIGLDAKEFTDDFCLDVPKHPNVIICKSAIMKCRKPDFKTILGYLVMAFDYHLNGTTLKSINKADRYLDKYDKKMQEVRNKEKSAHGAGNT